MIVLDLSILNQKGTPMFNSDTFANRPNFGIVGRIFISTDTSEIYRDTGTSWVLIADTSSGGTITGSGTTGTIPIWSGSTSLGNSSLVEAATLISTTKDIQADAYYLTGAAAANGALYFTSNRVTLANYNAGGIVHIEVNGGTNSTIFGTDLSLTNFGYIFASPVLAAANNASSLASFGINTLSYTAGFSSNNIGASYGGVAGFNLQTFAGSATFAQANLASAGVFVNSIDFSSASSTITMTQSSGIRAMTGNQVQLQYQGTNSGTITHAAVQQNLGFYRPSSASGVLTITNAYSHLINALDDYGAGFTFTNRFGIYQAGASDVNYFAASVLIGTNVNSGFKLDVSGTIGNNGGGVQFPREFRNDFTPNAERADMFLLANFTSNNSLRIGTLASSGGTTLQSTRANDSSIKTSLLLNPDGASVGIGTTAPTNGKLEIQTTVTTSALWVQTGGTTSGHVIADFRTGTNFSALQILGNGVSHFGGNVLINTSTNAGQNLYLNGSLRIDGQTSGTAGGNSGQHLIINLDGTQYKIKLENN